MRARDCYSYKARVLEYGPNAPLQLLPVAVLEVGRCPPDNLPSRHLLTHNRWREARRYL